LLFVTGWVGRTDGHGFLSCETDLRLVHPNELCIDLSQIPSCFFLMAHRKFPANGASRACPHSPPYSAAFAVICVDPPAIDASRRILFATPIYLRVMTLRTTTSRPRSRRANIKAAQSPKGDEP
jgi:hypothetical protein